MSEPEFSADDELWTKDRVEARKEADALLAAKSTNEQPTLAEQIADALFTITETMRPLRFRTLMSASSPTHLLTLTPF